MEIKIIKGNYVRKRMILCCQVSGGQSRVQETTSQRFGGSGLAGRTPRQAYAHKVFEHTSHIVGGEGFSLWNGGLL